MNEPIFLTPPPPPPAPSERKHSPWGIAGFIGGLLTVFSLCACLGLSFYDNSASLGYSMHETVLQVVGFMAICSGGLGVLSLILSIVGLVQQARSKVFAIIGLVLSLLTDLALCLILLLGFMLKS
jgi:hypothetical protein